MKSFKKLFLLMLILSIPMMSLTACSSGKTIHERIHDKYYMLNSYKATCTLNILNGSKPATYDFETVYRNTDEEYKVIYNDFTVTLNQSGAVIENDSTVRKINVKDGDMLIFINTFFKSYYVGEEASIKTSSGAGNKTFLECSLITPTEYADKMTLTINNKTLLPEKMQAISPQGKPCLEVIFKEFEFTT